jgi:hypothetical protein
MAGTRLEYCAKWLARGLIIAPNGWRKAWVLRQMAGARLEYCAKWLAQGLSIAPNGWCKAYFLRLMAGTKLAKGLKAEYERVMEHHLRKLRYKSVESRKLWALDLSESKWAKMENEVLKETYSESPRFNLNAFSDQIFREKWKSGGNRGNCQIQPPHGRSKKNATQFFLWYPFSRFYSDNMGRFPIRARSGNQYVMIAFHADGNLILQQAFKSKSDRH